MVSKIDTEIFLPITFQTYKKNKINLLKTHIKTVNTLERIKKLNELSKIKTQQRKLLKKTINDIKDSYSKLQKSLPTSLQIGILEQKHTEQVYTPHTKTYPTSFQPMSRIDEELNKIQEKLKNLKI